MRFALVVWTVICVIQLHITCQLLLLLLLFGRANPSVVVCVALLSWLWQQGLAAGVLLPPHHPFVMVSSTVLGLGVNLFVRPWCSVHAVGINSNEPQLMCGKATIGCVAS